MNKVLFLRRGFGITQDAVAKKLNISRPTVRKKEIGEIDFTKTEMEKLTELLRKYDSNLTIKEIFFT